MLARRLAVRDAGTPRAAAASVSLFGTSAKYLQMLEAAGAKPRTRDTQPPALAAARD
jgi:hypothetical protein